MEKGAQGKGRRGRGRTPLKMTQINEKCKSKGVK